MAGSAARTFIDLAIASSTSDGCCSMRVSRSANAARPRSPSAGEAKMLESLAPELGQMRIAAMTRIRPVIHDLGHDPRGPLAQYDNAAGQEQSLFHVMGYQKRGEARVLPQRHEL